MTECNQATYGSPFKKKYEQPEFLRGALIHLVVDVRVFEGSLDPDDVIEKVLVRRDRVAALLPFELQVRHERLTKQRTNKVNENENRDGFTGTARNRRVGAEMHTLTRMRGSMRLKSRSIWSKRRLVCHSYCSKC